ncbi:MAG: hydrogenase maturation nickel metallochaperone HypA [Anaerolineae bacterium]|nr:hydrogenase maturation nickel metallochaperone HypA [Anaerolineae bacterium]
MHEFGVAQQMLSLALAYAKQNNAVRITEFSIEMSQAANESEDSLRLHLETLARGTMAEGARVDIQRVPTHLHCLKCGNEFEQEYAGEACPKCSSARVIPKPIDEFKLASIEID